MTTTSSFQKPLAVLLFTAALGVSQSRTAINALSVRGYTGTAPVIQSSGKSYVEVESLARLTNGTLSFQGNQVTLSIGAAGAAQAPPAAANRAPRLSKEFLKAVIDELSVIGEWRTGLVNAIQGNNPLTPDWADAFRRNADSKLSIASATVTTEPDKSLLPLLQNEFAKMQALSDKYVTLRKTQTFVAPDALDNDVQNQQVQNCARALASLSAGGQFTDLPPCH